MTRFELHLSSDALQELRRRLTTRGETPVEFPAATAVCGDRRLWLVHGPTSSAGNHTARLLVVGAEETSAVAGRLRRTLRTVASTSEACILLALGLGAARGHLAGLVVEDGRVRSLDQVHIIGPGMLRIPPATLPDSADRQSLARILSRTIGALGDEAYTRLRSWHVAVIGCGRSGTLVAEALAALGIERLTLVDPDTVEVHNLGEMVGLDAEAVGSAKAVAVATSARRAAAARFCQLVPIPGPIQSLGSLHAVKPADVLVTCPDAAAARLASAVLAATFLKPLLDVGTGVLAGAAGPRMGADVRLTLPGRCLVCLGGLPNVAEARDALLRGKQPERVGDFRSERLGSLRSLNTLAVSLGLILLEQLAAGRVPGPVWLQADLDEYGLPRLTRRTPEPAGHCPICALTARGDPGLEHLSEIWQQL